jgi:hypothetical protein
MIANSECTFAGCTLQSFYFHFRNFTLLLFRSGSNLVMSVRNGQDVAKCRISMLGCAARADWRIGTRGRVPFIIPRRDA